MANKVYGRKTSIKLAASDIEIDTVKLRGLLCVRIRDLSKNECKVQLSLEEFYMLSSLTPAIDRYMQQLKFSGHVVKDYLMDTIQKQPNTPLLYGPVDT
ncbi:hypothetical protein, partial [Klebsiella pneumoniae]|uniref:hypothetical protein n=1 Tax=Klebsiella pneumoniae TaxID=573 RepID=UPI001C8F9111